ncbi:hypothetical protein NPIL_299941 [Nephila pilipes]|uniref:Uncharacterized protein n=1 Tax=Nephila pilipes TaxID=299642 RepID=A0A8X6PKV4_NEPPI|nr:hypothetical protein NPIL_299941 [Nephila pilipes]
MKNERTRETTCRREMTTCADVQGEMTTCAGTCADVQGGTEETMERSRVFWIIILCFRDKCLRRYDAKY